MNNMFPVLMGSGALGEFLYHLVLLSLLGWAVWTTRRWPEVARPPHSTVLAACLLLTEVIAFGVFGWATARGLTSVRPSTSLSLVFAALLPLNFIATDFDLPWTHLRRMAGLALLAAIALIGWRSYCAVAGLPDATRLAHEQFLQAGQIGLLVGGGVVGLRHRRWPWGLAVVASLALGHLGYYFGTWVNLDLFDAVRLGLVTSSLLLILSLRGQDTLWLAEPTLELADPLAETPPVENWVAQKLAQPRPPETENLAVAPARPLSPSRAAPKRARRAHRAPPPPLALEPVVTSAPLRWDDLAGTETPTGEEPEFPTDAGLCSYLGFDHDPTTRAAFPVPGHRCYLLPVAQAVGPEQQAAYCVAGGQAECPRYRAYLAPLPAPAQPVAARRLPSLGRAWLARLATLLGLLTLGGLLLGRWF